MCVLWCVYVYVVCVCVFGLCVWLLCACGGFVCRRCGCGSGANMCVVGGFVLGVL